MTSPLRTVSTFAWSFLLLTAVVAAQGSTSPAPAPGPGQTKPASLAGKWKMVVESESPDRESVVDFKIDGTKLTGTATAPSGTYPLTGELADGKLAFALQYRDTRLFFTGAPKPDGTLAGSLDTGEEVIVWTAKRIEEK